MDGLVGCEDEKKKLGPDYQVSGNPKLGPENRSKVARSLHFN